MRGLLRCIGIGISGVAVRRLAVSLGSATASASGFVNVSTTVRRLVVVRFRSTRAPPVPDRTADDGTCRDARRDGGMGLNPVTSGPSGGSEKALAAEGVVGGAEKSAMTRHSSRQSDGRTSV